jgi:hypothetical protein
VAILQIAGFIGGKGEFIIALFGVAQMFAMLDNSTEDTYFLNHYWLTIVL